MANNSDNQKKHKPVDEFDNLKNTELGLLVSSCLFRLEHISDHHVKERRRHFRVTNMIVAIISSLILIIAVFNLYYIYDFYKETMHIIQNIHDLDDTVKIISVSMDQVTTSMGNMKDDMNHLQGVYGDVSSMSGTMPTMQENMSALTSDMVHLNQSMHHISSDMQVIDFHLKSMSGNVTQMEHNIYDMARPMGKFNDVLP